MSVTEVVAQLRRAHALLTEARGATTEADTAIVDGATVFAIATTGSTQPEVAQIAHLARASGEEVRAAHALFVQAQEIIDGYCHTVAGHGIDGQVTERNLADENGQSVRPELSSDAGPFAVDAAADPAVRYAELIAELRRDGTKLSPERIVFMQRLRNGRIVWLEQGGSLSGLAHILLGTKSDEFESCGTAPEQVPELISAALDHGRPVGYSGEDRPVYEVEIDGDTRRVAVTVSDNGYIVGAHPISLDKILRPHLTRELL